MRNITAMFNIALAMAGCTGHGSTHVTRETADGKDLLYSEVWVTEGIAQFDCRASISGHCHYTLFIDECAGKAPDDACAAQPMSRFTLNAGSTRDLLGLPTGFSLCVRHDDTAVKPDCAPETARASAPDSRRAG